LAEVGNEKNNLTKIISLIVYIYFD